MAARAIASITVSFGMVSIPVKLYSATQPSAAISFNLLHAADGSRLKQQYVCAKEGVVVERTDMVKGYEFAKDQYVTFTPEELKEMEEKGTQTVEISEFVPAESIDPIYYDKAYYLGPDKGGEKPYALLVAAMQELGYTALATYSARGKSYLVLVRPAGDRLVMHQLHHADEVRPASEIPLEARTVAAPELKLARQLMEQIASEGFEPGKYDDEVRRRTLEVIERKLEGQPIEAGKTARPAKVVDLMEALKASLKEKGEARRAPQRAAARRSGPHAASGHRRRKGAS